MITDTYTIEKRYVKRVQSKNLSCKTRKYLVKQELVSRCDMLGGLPDEVFSGGFPEDMNPHLVSMRLWGEGEETPLLIRGKQSIL